MIKRRDWLAALAPGCLLAACAHRDPVLELLAQSERAMGSAAVRTLHYTGTGTGSTFGQAYQPGMAWPRVAIIRFERWIDYESGGLREDATRRRTETTGGGSLPPMGAGDQRSSEWLRGSFAWNVAGSNAVAAPVAYPSRVHDLWTTPYGVVKAAMRNHPALRSDGAFHVVSFTQPGQLRASVWIGPEGLPQRVDSVMPHPVMGDTDVSTLFIDWQDRKGFRFPDRIVQYAGGFQVLDLFVGDVQLNVPVEIEVPATVASFEETVDAQKVADGVWFLGGGSHNSVLIEFADHTMLVESPLYDGRAQAVFAQAKRLVPAKPLKYVVNSHHHFDHAGGLRAAAAEGATLVVSEQARSYFERVLSHPNSVQPDALQRSGRKVAITGVNGQRIFRDATREVDIFTIEDSPHAQGFMMVWLPNERLLVEADAYTPGPPNAPAAPSELNANLVANIGRLHLDVDRILPLHGRVVPAAALYDAAGRKN